MKKLLATILMFAMISSLLCGMTVFAADPTFTADKDWETGVYDAEAGTLSNGTYTFTVTLASSTMTITGFEGPADIAEVYIPLFNNGSTTYKTVVLNTGVFANYASINKVVAVDALTVNTGVFSASATNLEIVAGTTATLDSTAFAECTAIEKVSVTAPTSITINKLTDVFNCATLQTISFDSAKFVIGGNAFSNCANFDKIILNGTPLGVKLESGNFKVNIRKDMEFHKNRKDPFSSSSLEWLTFEEGITTTVEYQFRGVGMLKYIDFPTSMRTIGGYCFKDCSSVISLDSSKDENDPNVVWDISQITSLSSGALYMSSLKGEVVLGVGSVNKELLRTSKITKVTFANKITSISSDALYGASSVKELVFTKGPLPTFPTKLNSAPSNIVVIYPDTEIESFKAATVPSNIVAKIPFGGYVHTFAENAEGGYDVTYAVANYNAKNIGKAVIALYDDAGAMIGAKTVDASVGTTLTTVNVPANGVAASAKIFTLGDFNNLVPQYVNYEFVPPVEDPAA